MKTFSRWRRQDLGKWITAEWADLVLRSGGWERSDQVEGDGSTRCWQLGVESIRALATEPVDQMLALGRDDFSFHRGGKCGTILVERTRHSEVNLAQVEQRQKEITLYALVACKNLARTHNIILLGTVPW